jgi:hypothetical protein
MPGALDRSPKKNWIENRGGLPSYIERIAVHLNNKGMTISHAIATAINVVKKACATGDLNYPGIQKENAGSQAEACAAVAAWEKLKSSKSKVKASALGPLDDLESIELSMTPGESLRACRAIARADRDTVIALAASRGYDTGGIALSRILDSVADHSA